MEALQHGCYGCGSAFPSTHAPLCVAVHVTHCLVSERNTFNCHSEAALAFGVFPICFVQCSTCVLPPSGGEFAMPAAQRTRSNANLLRGSHLLSCVCRDRFRNGRLGIVAMIRQRTVLSHDLVSLVVMCHASFRMRGMSRRCTARSIFSACHRCFVVVCGTLCCVVEHW